MSTHSHETGDGWGPCPECEREKEPRSTAAQQKQVSKQRKKARRLRKIAAAQARTQFALGRRCPTCGVQEDVWCGNSGLLGPWMHDRRYLPESRPLTDIEEIQYAAAGHVIPEVRRTLASPASPKQKAFISGLLGQRVVPQDLRLRALRSDLTDGDCREIIPALQACPRYEDYEDFTSPEGYDDSPDQGVHQFDGGGAW